MKKYAILWTCLAISLIIVLGFTGTTMISHQTYKKIIEDDIEDISKLTSSNIYSEIDGELTKPIFVAQTMANDSFLKEWLYEEKREPVNEVNSKKLQEYLYTYKQKYQYDAVYMISASSSIYYYFDGVNKVVSPENEHDQWYYNFLEDGVPYRLNIDWDEVGNNELTVFVDCRVESADGELLGVTGVGVRMSRLQELLRQHETDYHLQAFLINSAGEVQVDTETSKIRAANLFDEPGLEELRDTITGNRETMEMHWYPEGQMDNCIITRYIENMDWYLVVRKNTQEIRASFQEMVKKDVLIISAILAVLLTLSMAVMRRHNRTLTRILSVDALTDLPNQQAFHDSFGALSGEKKTILFLFDVDRFKRINDTKGHLFGNEVLATVARTGKACVGSSGMLARWGGDEFVGVLSVSAREAQDILEKLKTKISEACRSGDVEVTVSIGVAVIEEGLTLDDLIARADQALYVCKDRGGNEISWFDEQTEIESE